MIEPVMSAPAGEAIAAWWRRWRAPAALVAFILLGGIVVALVASPQPVTGALDPRDTGPSGAHAVVALLEGRGQQVARVTNVTAAVTASRAPGTILLVTDSSELGPGSATALRRAPADLILVTPDRATLAVLAPQVTLVQRQSVRPLPASCALPAAELAGSASMGGEMLRTARAGAWRCYPAQTGGPGPQTVAAAGVAAPTRPASLVRYATGGRTVTVLGTGAPLTNAALGQEGNAALAMNLLGTGHRVVWLVPGLAPPSAPAASQPSSLQRLIPDAVHLVTFELAVAVVLAALWRIRRFGPLVPEPLPIVVRASETVRGHGRLYRARRARGRAAAVLRTAAVARINARLGLPAGIDAAALCLELADRTGRDPAGIHTILFGPVPGDDAALVALATDLDRLEGQVLAQ